ncbi:MAG: glycoside hydrolase family 38 C-terminal domain-containing protein, partial [Gemmatimonadota bacterium]
RYHYPDQDVVDRVYVAFEAPEVGGCGLMQFTVRDEPSSAAARGMTATMERLGNDQMTVDLHPDGRFSVTDLTTAIRYERLGGFHAEIDRGDTYTVESDQREAGVEQAGGWRVTAHGPLVVAAEARGALAIPMHGQVRWRKSVVLHADSPLTHLRIDLWNYATDHRLRLHVPTGASGLALAGAPFGSIAREPVQSRAASSSAERPVTTAPAHRFVAVADERRGLAVLAPGFFEYDHGRGGDLHLTLLRAVGELSRNDLSARPGHAAWPMPVPDAQEPGHHVITLALAPVTGLVHARPDRIDHLWEDFALGCSSWWLGTTGPIRSEPVGITLCGDGLVASVVKPAEDGNGLILRAYNARAAATKGTWQFVQRVAKVTRVRADETELEAMPLVEGRHTVQFEARPHALVSIRVTLRSPRGR